jgi:pyridoxal 5'-phosphate synthase pdxS subunit
MMQLGAESVFVGSSIFKSGDPMALACAIVQAVTYYNDPPKLVKASTNLSSIMAGFDTRLLREEDRLSLRGW